MTEPRRHPARATRTCGRGPSLDCGSQELGARVVVVTNQSTLTRGRLSADGATAMHRHLQERLDRRGVTLAGIYACPHHPDGAVAQFRISGTYRKPRPGATVRRAR